MIRLLLWGVVAVALYYLITREILPHVGVGH